MMASVLVSAATIDSEIAHHGMLRSISLSIVAAETSTLTIISIPGLAYDSNLTFLQVVMGYVIGRVIISVVLLPQYFRGELYTAYQLIERRFCSGVRTMTAGPFLFWGGGRG